MNYRVLADVLWINYSHTVAANSAKESVVSLKNENVRKTFFSCISRMSECHAAYEGNRQKVLITVSLLRTKFFAVPVTCLKSSLKLTDLPRAEPILTSELHIRTSTLENFLPYFGFVKWCRTKRRHVEMAV